METSFSHPPALSSSEMGILVGARGPDSPAQPGVAWHQQEAPSNGILRSWSARTGRRPPRTTEKVRQPLHLRMTC